MQKNYNTTKMLQYLAKAIRFSDEKPELASLEVQDEDTILITYINGDTKQVHIHHGSNLAAMIDILDEV